MRSARGIDWLNSYWRMQDVAEKARLEHVERLKATRAAAAESMVVFDNFCS
jgi:hypothetical protein